jgi:hypothetical protein
MQASSAVDQQQHHVGFVDGRHGLLGHGRIDAGLVAGNAPGVDHDKPLLSQFAFTVLPVTGQPRQIRNQRVTGSSELIKQS